ncbi:MAG: hypothetical protein ACP5IV_00440 [Caldisericia bacterium]
MIGPLSGKNFIQKLSYFIYTFGVWDIFYYITLKIFLNRPQSILAWDILFLIPVPWIRPVIAHVTCASTMILMGIIIINFEESGINMKIDFFEWIFIILGSLIILFTFIYDYLKLIIDGIIKYGFKNLMNNIVFLNEISMFIPTKYNYLLFIIGEILIVIIRIYLKSRRKLFYR